MSRQANVAGAVALLILGIGLLVVGKFGYDYMTSKARETTSDAAGLEGTLRVAGDNWAGYVGLHARSFKKALREAGYGLDWQDDGADYSGRLAAFNEGRYDLIVATVDSYLVNGAPHDFPGVIIAVIDESRGGDAIVARRAIESINDLGAKGRRIAVTPNSPSDFFLKAVSSHFSLAQLMRPGPWRVETAGSTDARARLEKGTVDAAVLWEPDVSAALASEDLHKLIGTESTRRLIVDILVAHRDAVLEKEEALRTFVGTYFDTMELLLSSRELLRDELVEQTGHTNEAVGKMMEGIHWVGLRENGRQWFGLAPPGIIAEEGLADTIASTVTILRDHRVLKDDPLQGNPYTILNSTFIKGLLEGGASTVLDRSFTVPSGQATPAAARRDFPPLDEAGWARTRPVGKLKVRPIVFQSGTSLLTVAGKNEIDKAVEALGHYPTFRLVIKGHSAPGGEEEANRRLSRERAAAVAKYIETVYDVDPDRIRVVGAGSSEPLPRRAGEGYRAWKYRQPRVEFLLVEDPS